MPTELVQIALIVAGVIIALALIYTVFKFYSTRQDFTYMTHDDQGFKRALSGRGVIWDVEEFVVKGASAPKIEFVSIDPATGGRRMTPLLDVNTGSVNLRPQYCVPLPFTAQTFDGHRIMVEARVQFSLNRDKMSYVYHVQDFGLALETRIQSAFRAEIGKRHDEELRRALHEAEAGAVQRLRQAEADGDEEGEVGMALGAVFHSASFTYSEFNEDSAPMAFATVAPSGGASAAIPGAASAAVGEAMRQVQRANGVLALRHTQLDQLADVFKGRDPASTHAILTMLELQTRQNIAEALAATGHLIVLTPQELGLAGLEAQRDGIARAREHRAAAHSAQNGAGAGAGAGSGEGRRA